MRSRPEQASLSSRLRGLLATPVPWFALLAALLLWWHEPWRDEAEHWLLVRDSPTLGAFLEALRYEGTPALWHLLMAPLAKLGLPFLAARVLHAAIAVAGVAVLWRLAPFARWQKWLLAFGYYAAYEYNAIARNYALFGLALFLVAHADARRRERPVPYACALGALANTTLHGLLVAGVLAAAHGLDVLRGLRRGAWTRGVTAGLAVLVGAFLVAALPMRTPADLDPLVAGWGGKRGPLLGSWNVPNSILLAFAPVPAPEHVFWNSILVDGLGGALKVALAALLAAGSVWTLRRSRRATLLYVLLAVLFESFFVFKYYGYAHHAGLLFLVFLACWWIALKDGRRTEPPAVPPALRRPAPARFAARCAAAFVPVVLVLHAVGGAVAVGREATGEFSGAASLALWLQENGFVDGRTFIAVYHGETAHAVLALLDPDVRFFFIEFGDFRTFATWSEQWREGNLRMDLRTALARMDAADDGFERALLVESDRSLVGPGAPEADLARLQHLARVGDAPIGAQHENYDVYLVRPSST